MLANKRALILTSATLSTGTDRWWVLERLGLAGDEALKAPVFLRAPSPFKLEQHALVVLVTDAPRPSALPPPDTNALGAALDER